MAKIVKVNIDDLSSEQAFSLGSVVGRQPKDGMSAGQAPRLYVCRGRFYSEGRHRAGGCSRWSVRPPHVPIARHSAQRPHGVCAAAPPDHVPSAASISASAMDTPHLCNKNACCPATIRMDRRTSLRVMLSAQANAGVLHPHQVLDFAAPNTWTWAVDPLFSVPLNRTGLYHA
jgi:hypothetical protein